MDGGFSVRILFLLFLRFFMLLCCLILHSVFVTIYAVWRVAIGGLTA